MRFEQENERFALRAGPFILFCLRAVNSEVKGWALSLVLVWSQPLLRLVLGVLAVASEFFLEAT